VGHVSETSDEFLLILDDLFLKCWNLIFHFDSFNNIDSLS